ncbi:MAG: hypothetical protein H0X41_04730 [Chitinophagaceae bacterium]|nr:hypothetical protein [Chitinophagaceae bacterium]
MILGLRTKLGGNDYTVIQSYTEPKASEVTVPLGSLSVLKIKSIGHNAFRCRLLPRDTLSYSYTPDKEIEDLLHFTATGDTLVLEYAPPPDTSGHHMRVITGEADLDLHVPVWQTLEIDGATVQVDSSWGNLSPQQLILKKGGQLIIGSGYDGR